MYGCVALLWGEFSRNGSDRNAIVLRRERRRKVFESSPMCIETRVC
jgi:hypothetical protein